ncbi:unnamed protein product, partial [Meganyctiphanes norvegica]
KEEVHSQIHITEIKEEKLTSEEVHSQSHLSDHIEEKVIKKIKKKKHKLPKLDNPLRGNALSSAFSSVSSASVFYNPFHEEQKEKNSILEKHVKMTENPKDVIVINGKRICWTYRKKGRCRFGRNCKFAHDTELLIPDESKQNQEPDLSSNTSKKSKEKSKKALNKKKQGTVIYNEPSYGVCTETESSIEETIKKKKRPGLSQNLTPGKKVMKNYQEQQSKETPWLVKR